MFQIGFDLTLVEIMRSVKSMKNIWKVMKLHFKKQEKDQQTKSVCQQLYLTTIVMINATKFRCLCRGLAFRRLRYSTKDHQHLGKW